MRSGPLCALGAAGSACLAVLGGFADPGHGVPRMISGDQDRGGLGQQVDGQGPPNAYPIRRRPRRWRCSQAPESSQITTVDAPISISESRPNPASATDRAEIAASASTTI